MRAAGSACPRVLRERPKTLRARDFGGEGRRPRFLAPHLHKSPLKGEPMDTNVIVLIALGVVVVLALGAWAYARRRRHDRLVDHFGPVYGRAVEQFGGPSKADAELAARERAFAKANVRPLTTADRDRLAGLWQSAQARFVDSPKAAVEEADRLIEDVMRLRGYPVGDPAQRLADVAMGHPHLLDHYRGAREIALRTREGGANTEDLRTAMVHYRELFEDLLEVGQPELAGSRT